MKTKKSQVPNPHQELYKKLAAAAASVLVIFVIFMLIFPIAMENKNIDAEMRPTISFIVISIYLPILVSSFSIFLLFIVSINEKSKGERENEEDTDNGLIP